MGNNDAHGEPVGVFVTSDGNLARQNVRIQQYSSSGYTATGRQLNNEHDDGGHQQEPKPGANRVSPYQAQDPCNQQDRKYQPEHKHLDSTKSLRSADEVLNTGMGLLRHPY